MSTVTEYPPLHTGNGRAGATLPPEEFRGPGFRFVRVFLLLILGIVGLTLLLAGTLGWYMGMEVTVEGRGAIEPVTRCQVKAKIDGIVKTIRVHQGQRVAAGDPIATLDGSEWKAKRQELEKEIETNRSQKAETEARIRQDRDLARAEILQNTREIETRVLRLEQTRKEYLLYYETDRHVPNPDLDRLLPVRLQEAMLRKAEADRERARKQLDGVRVRRQEIQTLDTQREKLDRECKFLDDRLARLVLYAPKAGTVLTGDLQQRVGDRLQTGETLLQLAQPGNWQARIMVREVDIPRVKTGQPVRLYVDAFPHMEYKIFDGVVREVAAKPAPESPPKPEPVYPVKVSIRDPVVSDGERTYTLAYGMRAEARIVVDHGRILDLLWRHLLRTVGKTTRHHFYVQ